MGTYTELHHFKPPFNQGPCDVVNVQSSWKFWDNIKWGRNLTYPRGRAGPGPVPSVSEQTTHQQQSEICECQEVFLGEKKFVEPISHQILGMMNLIIELTNQ